MREAFVLVAPAALVPYASNTILIPFIAGAHPRISYLYFLRCRLLTCKLLW